MSGETYRVCKVQEGGWTLLAVVGGLVIIDSSRFQCSTHRERRYVTLYFCPS